MGAWEEFMNNFNLCGVKNRTSTKNAGSEDVDTQIRIMRKPEKNCILCCILARNATSG